MYTIAPVLFPQLITLFQTEALGPSTRARALSIFGVFTTLISHMDSVEAGVNEKLLFPILPGLVDSSLALLQGAPSARARAVAATTHTLGRHSVGYVHMSRRRAV